MIRITTEDATYLVQLLINAGHAGHSLTQRLRNQVENGRNDGDLIDVIADAIQNPIGRGILSGSNMEFLRSELLLPREALGLKAKLRERVGCVACGRDIANGELMSLPKGHEPYCVYCHYPMYVSCSGCKNVLSLNDGIKRIIGKLVKECPVCRDKNTSKDTPPANAAIDEGAPTPAVDTATDGIEGRRVTWTAIDEVEMPPLPTLIEAANARTVVGTNRRPVAPATRQTEWRRFGIGRPDET